MLGLSFISDDDLAVFYELLILERLTVSQENFKRIM